MSADIGSFCTCFNVSPVGLSICPQMICPSYSGIHFPENVPGVAVTCFLQVDSSRGGRVTSESLRLTETVRSDTSSGSLLMVNSTSWRVL